MAVDVIGKQVEVKRMLSKSHDGRFCFFYYSQLENSFCSSKESFSVLFEGFLFSSILPLPPVLADSEPSVVD